MNDTDVIKLKEELASVPDYDSAAEFERKLREIEEAGD